MAARPPHVVILSSTFGGGHQRVAEVLCDEVRRRHPGATVEIFDFYADFINPTLNRVLTATYVQLVRHAPRLWWAFYTSTNEVSTESAFQRLINGFGMRRWLGYRALHRPDLAICTHPTPAGTVSQANLAGSRTPCVTAITDYVVHSQWVHRGVDRYAVPSQEVADDLARRGVGSDRMIVTGVPVDPTFAEPVDRAGVTAAFGLDPALPVVLLMVGAQALVTGLERVVHDLLDSAPMNLIAVAGQSEPIVRRLRQITHPRLRILGFTTSVPDLMGAADLLITKPGGVTVSEAFCRGLPMVLFRPIPGQEDGNVAHAVRGGAAVLAGRSDDIAGIAARLLADRERLEVMAARSRALGRPRAAAEAVDVVDSLLAAAAA